MTQLPLELPIEGSFRSEDFLLSKANQEAHALVMEPESWRSHALILEGPTASGKTHLARVWKERFGASEISGEGSSEELFTGQRYAVLDDINKIKEATLFHLLNFAKERGFFLLLVQAVGVSATLPDLASRLAALPKARLLEPDDALLAQVLAKHFADRQLRVGNDVIQYLTARMERSFSAAAQIVAALDRRAIASKRAITVPFARELLDG